MNKNMHNIIHNNIWMSNGRAVYARCSRWYRAVYAYEMSDVGYVNIIKVVLFKVNSPFISVQRFESVC
jgi:hypothetical protein